PPASWAGARGIARIDGNGGDACIGTLVLEEKAQLVESPARMFSPLLSANRDPGADVRQVFDGNSAPGAFGSADDLFADAVVNVGGTTPFLATPFVEQTASAPRAQLLQSAPHPAGDLPHSAQFAPGV